MKNRLILDACSVINIYHIDEDDFLLDIIKNLEFKISEQVYLEVCKNIHKKFIFCKKNSISYDKEKEKNIPNLLSYLRRVYVDNKEIKKDLGNVFAEIKDYCKLTREENGELYSCALSLVKSRCDCNTINFYTDDSPAINSLKKYFNFQQIGNISDTADLLIYIYWAESKFNIHKLKHFLSSLASEYKYELVILTKTLLKFKELLSIKDLRNREFMQNLEKLINKLLNLNFKGLADNYNYFKLKSNKPSKDICTIFKEFDKIFELENNLKETSLINKIAMILRELEHYYIFKIA